MKINKSEAAVVLGRAGGKAHDGKKSKKTLLAKYGKNYFRNIAKRRLVKKKPPDVL